GAPEALDHAEQLERAEGLAQEGVRAGGIRLRAAALVGAGQEHDADAPPVGIALDGVAEGEPVLSRHADVEDHDVRLRAHQVAARGGRVLGLGDLDRDDLEGRPEELPEGWIVVDEQDAHCGSPWRFRNPQFSPGAAESSPRTAPSYPAERITSLVVRVKAS